MAKEMNLTARRSKMWNSLQLLKLMKADALSPQKVKLQTTLFSIRQILHQVKVNKNSSSPNN